MFLPIILKHFAEYGRLTCTVDVFHCQGTVPQSYETFLKFSSMMETTSSCTSFPSTISGRKAARPGTLISVRVIKFYSLIVPAVLTS